MCGRVRVWSHASPEKACDGLDRDKFLCNRWRFSNESGSLYFLSIGTSTRCTNQVSLAVPHIARIIGSFPCFMKQVSNNSNWMLENNVNQSKFGIKRIKFITKCWCHLLCVAVYNFASYLFIYFIYCLFNVDEIN